MGGRILVQWWRLWRVIQCLLLDTVVENGPNECDTKQNYESNCAVLKINCPRLWQRTSTKADAFNKMHVLDYIQHPSLHILLPYESLPKFQFQACIYMQLFTHLLSWLWFHCMALKHDTSPFILECHKTLPVNVIQYGLVL